MDRRLVVGALGLVACEDVGSGDVKTSGLWAEVRFVADGSGGSQAITVLKVGGPLAGTFVQLEGEDTLTATLSDEAVVMAHEQLGDAHRYVAGFDTAPAGETLTVAFERTVDTSAPSSTATLPPAFELDAPAVTTFARGTEDLVLTWSPASSQPVRIDATGDCVWPATATVLADAGTYTLPAGTLVPFDEAAPASCPIDVAVTRIEPGTVDPAFGEGGIATGEQIRTTSVGSTP
jgi:hypothetical protein